MKVNCVLIYPPVYGIQSPVSIRHIPIELNIGCHKWQTNTAMRHGFCELVFAGAGNHPGLYDGGPNYYGVAHSIWKLIQDPVTEDIIFGKFYCFL